MTPVDGRPALRLPRFDGICTLCGWAGPFVLTRPRDEVARDFCCGSCGSSLRHQAEAAAILDSYGRGKLLCLDKLVRDEDFRRRSVFYVGHVGPIRNRLKHLDDYSESCYRLDVPFGQAMERHPNRTNQDHQRLMFPDDRFDLVLSSHVLEHVSDPAAALAEAFRVLKPAGRYIFSIPGRLEGQSVVRAETRGRRVVHLQPAQYHQSPEGKPALVFTDFGADLVDLLEQIGFVALVSRSHRSIQEANRSFVVVAIKPPVMRRRPRRRWKPRPQGG